jgi:hypothetical protein
MPETLPAVTELLPKLPTQDFRRLFVLHGAYGLGPALDLEARANETGAADVQLADYRNAAHGRHVGLAARAEDTLVVALRDGDDAALPERTLSLLPRHIARVELTSPLQFPASAADQTVRVIRLFGQLAAARGIDPGRPSVPSFGRRLYHLGWRSGGDELLPAVRRKLRVAGAPAHGAAAAAYYTEALRTWSQQLRSTRFGGVVLDYDGTCCTTAGRFDLPDEPVRDELTRLLDAKASLAFASGRGRSLHHDLRRWIPDAFWHAVIVGLYNGALILTLAEEVPPHAPCEGELAFAADRLDELAADFGLLVERRAYQITVTSAPESRLSTAGLASIVQSSLARVPTLSVTTARSAHSLDITAMRTSKVQVLEAVGARAQAPVIAVGDQGQVDGNDFGFLAAVPHSLSVDQCSADPTRCWNLGADDERGPRLLVRYLRHLAPDRRGQLRWQPR